MWGPTDQIDWVTAVIWCHMVQGYVVFSVEHADGTASAAELAYGAGWLYYQGWGSDEARMAQTRYNWARPMSHYMPSLMHGSLNTW